MRGASTLGSSCVSTAPRSCVSAYLVLPEYSTAADVEDVRAESRAAARRALELDPDQSDALTAMGWGRLVQDYDWQAAEELIGRALLLNPTNVRALHWQSHVLSWRGRHDEAVALASRADELAPLSPIMRQNLGYILRKQVGTRTPWPSSSSFSPGIRTMRSAFGPPGTSGPDNSGSPRRATGSKAG